MVNEEEIKKQAEDIHKELYELNEDAKDIDQGSKQFFKILIGFFMALIIILMIVPYYSIKYNPEPKPIGEIEKNWDFNYTNTRLDSLYDVPGMQISNIVRGVSIQITSQACKPSEVCYAKALFYFVRDDINYLSDPKYEYIQSPEETLLGAGDCEDKSILLAFLMESIGIRSRIVVIPGHAYVEVFISNAPNRYKSKNGWIPLDTTCSYCKFGEIPRENKGQKSVVIAI